MAEECAYPVFKGLQKPLEFMGIRGRFLLIAALTVGATFIIYFALSLTVGQLPGILTALACLGSGLVSIYVKQKTGLHAKKRFRGVIIYHNLYKH